MKGLESLKAGQKFNRKNLVLNRPRGRGITYQVPTTYQFHWWSSKHFPQQKYVNLPQRELCSLICAIITIYRGQMNLLTRGLIMYKYYVITVRAPL